MFEHLPVITEGSVLVMLEKELPYFTERLKTCTAKTETPDQAIDCMCQEFIESNPFLVKATRSCAYGVAGELEGEVEPEGAEWRAAMCAVAGLLAALRLVDRALEAKELETRMGS